MYAWDVVSGVFNGDGQWHPNVFYNTLGPNYVKIALQAARAADPTAKLYIEEYAAQRLSAKSDALFALVQSLKASGVPLDGVAFEGQFSPGDPLNMASVTANTARFAGYGNVAVELGVRNINGPITPSQQQDYYVAVVLVCLNSPKCIGVLTSGIVDAYTLYGTSSGSLSWTETLFDANYQTVLAYYGIADKLATATIDGSYA
ncbi:hypothetical protein FS837_007527 [Tulasnella sp. UAMH 9824]|nr:hypothetical protein FS837_007527 [Tulasnella sp. UAMH 9824]